MDLQKRRKQRSSTMELVVDDVVEQILERLPLKSLLRFKTVSKQWKSTIESPFFQHKHLTYHRQKLKTPDLLMINTDYTHCKDNLQILESIITLELESSISRNIPIPWENNLFMFCQNSIDGLVCIYNEYDSGVIFNPTTRWYRTLPPSTYQQRTRPDPRWRDFTPLGFGKDQINGLYKPVWLYNSSELGKNNNGTTTCEVFDFKINAWRFVEPSSPKRIYDWDGPVYLNGLLYWLTEKEEMLTEKEEIRSVLSFDLHTETFEIVCKTPISDMLIFNLDDNLCGWNYFDVGHVIWSWNIEEKTWKKIYFIDLYEICTLYNKEVCMCEVRPLLFVEEKKKKLILCDYDCCWDLENRQVVLCESHGPETHTTRYRRVVSKRGCKRTLCYFQSLISIL